MINDRNRDHIELLPGEGRQADNFILPGTDPIYRQVKDAICNEALIIDRRDVQEDSFRIV